MSDEQCIIAEMALERLRICTSCSPCGRLCHRLVKGPGKSHNYCVDISDGSKILLYTALEDAEFECPEGLFYAMPPTHLTAPAALLESKLAIDGAKK